MSAGGEFPGCVCRRAGQAGTSFNETAVPLPGGGNAACVVLWMGFDWIAVACPATSSGVRFCPSLEEPESTEGAGTEKGFSAGQNKDIYIYIYAKGLVFFIATGDLIFKCYNFWKKG